MKNIVGGELMKVISQEQRSGKVIILENVDDRDLITEATYILRKEFHIGKTPVLNFRTPMLARFNVMTACFLEKT